MESNTYPQHALFLSMDPRQVDVNVHPTKIEVRFADEKYVHDVLYRAVQDALKKPVSVPDLQLAPRKSSGSLLSRRHSITVNEAQLTFDAQAPIQSGESSYRPPPGREGPMLWQVHNRYILSQIKSGLTIIDQHVAHERILYEKALRARDEEGAVSQQLLFPQTVECRLDDFSVLMDMLPYLEKIGFGIKAFGKTTVVVEAVPSEVKMGEERVLLHEIIDAFKEMREECDDRWDAVAKSYACKSAIKSGDRLTFTEMASLIDQLFATEDPYTCPHGRPIIVNLSLEEIDKRFGRS
jgi:DNA mismatch repair protein MutL